MSHECGARGRKRLENERHVNERIQLTNVLPVSFLFVQSRSGNFKMINESYGRRMLKLNNGKLWLKSIH